MDNSGQQVIPKKKSKKKWIAIGIVIVIVIIIAAVVLSPKTKTITLVTSGTVINVPAGHYIEQGFSFKVSGTISGSISATSGITFYLMSPSQYSSMQANGTFSEYTYTTGDISSGSINTNIGSGTWYVVFYNSNIITPTTVTVNSLTFTN
jgi:uncharacterized integral membrane protein